jgi:hypothetical protein
LKYRPSDSNQPIFIFGCSQRTGSTLLGALLNSHRNIMLWGEHSGYLNKLQDAYNDLMAWKKLHPDPLTSEKELHRIQSSPNAMPDTEILVDAFRLHVKSLFPVPNTAAPDCIWGFKEVRYSAWHALFLQELFPQARFIHLVRDARGCLLSMRHLEYLRIWDKDWTESAMANWVYINRSFVEGRNMIRNCHQVKFEELTGDNAGRCVDALEKFLGFAENSLDRNTLTTRVDFSPAHKLSNALSEEDETFLVSPVVADLRSAYGYTS